MIRIIAFITMLLDHIGVFFFPNILILRIIGRIAFPLFAYGIASGYKFTKNFKFYLLRLFLVASVSQIPYYLLHEDKELNVCFTLLAGLVIIKIYECKFIPYIKYSIILLIMICCQYLNFEYGIYGILTIIIFHCFYNRESMVIYQTILTFISILIFKYDPIQLVSVFASFIVLFVNITHKDFKLNKFLQYGFYPGHLIIILFIKIMGGL